MRRFSLGLPLIAGLLIAACGATPQATPVATPSPKASLLTASPPSAAPSPPPSAPSPPATVTPTLVPSSPTEATAPTPSTRPASTMMTGDVGGTDLHFTVDLPNTWTWFGFGARSVPGTEHVEVAGAAFFVSIVDNTFQDPCEHIARSPKVGSTTDAVTAALTAIPGTVATQPVAVTLGDWDATYIELQLPDSLPCSPASFYLWQDSPDSYWYLIAASERIRIWVVDVQDTSIVVAARSWPGTGEGTKHELEQILASLKFPT